MQQLEHRLCKRTPIHVPAVIYHRGVPVDEGDAVEASGDGVTVRGVTITLPHNTYVELELRPTSRGEPRVKLPAMVRHQSGDRTGLFITDPEGLHDAIIERLADPVSAEPHADDA